MKKKTKHSTLSNNLYILKQIHTASPGRILFDLSGIIITSVSNILLDVYLLKYIINGIQEGLDFKRLVGFILIITAFHIFSTAFSHYYWQKFAPVSNQKIYSHIQKALFEKSSSVELACFEDPDFYDKYVKAISEANNRTQQVLGSLGDIVYFIFNAFATSFIIFTIDPVLIVFALIPFMVSILFGKRLNKVRYNYNMEMQEKSRKRDYVKRVFYLADYAKEMRLTNINRVMFKKFYEAIKERKGVIKKYGLKVALLDYLFIAVNDIIVFLGAILYSAYKTLVSKSMLYGDCVVVINGINNVAWSLRNMADVFIKINGAAMPCPSSFTWGLQDISASESGRTDDTIMHKNRVGQKRKLEIGWNAPEWEKACKIVQAVNPEYISVEYPDLLSGNKHEVRTFYVGDRSAPFKCWWVGNQRMEGLQFDLIEQ